jgi:flagellar motor switch protein FliN/FliY
MSERTKPGEDLSAYAEVRVRVRAVLPATAMSLEDLSRLEPGALVRLALRASVPAELVVNGCCLAEGQVVSVGGRRALALSEVIG